jgi:VWFA-related protein
MNCTPRALFIACVLGTPAFAQNPGQPPPQAQPNPEIQTLHVSTRLVAVDVVLTDSHGNPIKGLKKSDFAIVEGRAPQTIATFEEHVAQPARLAPVPKMPPGIFSNYSPAPTNTAVNILLLDALNTPLVDQAVVRDEMLRYLKTATPGVPMAIFGLNTRLYMLQSFTSDPNLLKQAISGKNPTSTPLTPDTAENDASDMMNSISNVIPDPAIASNYAYNVANFEATIGSSQLQNRISYTLDALDQLARYLASIPGRKNLIWFSGSFPINILPTTDTAGNPFNGEMEMKDEFRQTVDLLGLAQVAVYPIDARGLMVSPSFNADSAGTQITGVGGLNRAEETFSNNTASEHGTMFEMARNTGGKAFVDDNGLAKAVASAIDNGANYYTITYTPSDTRWQGAYRDIHVNLTNPAAHHAATLAYRHGYFADDPDSPRARDNRLKGAGPTGSKAFDSMRSAMLHGGPPATQVMFKVAILPASESPEPDPLAGNNPAPRAKGPWLRYMVQFAADSHELTPTKTPDGKIRLALQFVAIVYDSEGNSVNNVVNTVASTMTPAQFADLRRTGIPYRQQISVPAKGSYSIRVIVNDQQGIHLGAVEIPVAAVRNLPPVEIPPPARPATTPAS